MARSQAASVDEYLASLSEERRDTVSAVRALILEHLPAGYVESVNFGMLCYSIPLSHYPDTYNKQPLAYVSLASQKNFVSLYLMAAYQDSEQGRLLREGFARAGKKLDMGKSCVRFRRLEDLPLDVIAASVASTPPEAFIRQYEALRPGGRWNTALSCPASHRPECSAWRRHRHSFALFSTGIWVRISQ